MKTITISSSVSKSASTTSWLNRKNNLASNLLGEDISNKQFLMYNNSVISLCAAAVVANVSVTATVLCTLWFCISLINYKHLKK